MLSEINIDLNIPVDKKYCDEWGAAYVWINKEQTMGVEYNLAYENGECQSAIYPMYMMFGDPSYPMGYLGTDTTRFMQYEINFDDKNWRGKLIKAMEKYAAFLLGEGYWFEDDEFDDEEWRDE